MITWGPKIETGYSVEPQLYRDKDERVNRAAKNSEKVERLQKAVEYIRTTPTNRELE